MPRDRDPTRFIKKPLTQRIAESASKEFSPKANPTKIVEPIPSTDPIRKALLKSLTKIGL